MTEHKFRFYSLVPLGLFLKDSDGGYVKVVNDFTQSAIINTLTGTRYDKAITLDALLQARRVLNQEESTTQQTAQDILKTWESQGCDVDLESGTITLTRKRLFIFPYSKVFKVVSYPYDNRLLRLSLSSPINEKGITLAIISIANLIPSFALKEGKHELFRESLENPFVARAITNEILRCMKFAESGK